MAFSSERLILRLKPPTEKHVGAAHPKPTPGVCQRSCTPEGSPSPSTRQEHLGLEQGGQGSGTKVNQPPSCPLGTWGHRSPHADPGVSPRPDSTPRPHTRCCPCGCVCQPGLNTLPFPFPSLRSVLAPRTDCPLSLLSIRAGVTHQLHGKSPAWGGGGRGDTRMSHPCFLSQGQECLHWGCQRRAHHPPCPGPRRRAAPLPAPGSIPAAAGAGPAWPASPPGCRSSGSSATCH